MKIKTILLTIAMMLMFSTAFAAGPYLVCLPQAGVDYYIVSGLPAVVSGSHVPPDSTGTWGFKLDLSGSANGTYTVTAQACSNFGGCTASSSPFSFSVSPKPGVPTNLQISF